MEERCRACNNRLNTKDVLYDDVSDGLCFECLTVSLEAAYDPDNLLDPNGEYHE